MAIIRPTGYLSHYGFSPEETDEYLEHYGVKGMKWGKRLKTRVGLAIQRANAKADDYESKRRMAELYNEGAAESDRKAQEADAKRKSDSAHAEYSKTMALQSYRDAAERDAAGKSSKWSRALAKDASKYYNYYASQAKAAKAEGIAQRSAAATRRIKQAAYSRQAKANKSGARIAKVRSILNALKPNPNAGSAKLTNAYTGETTVIKKKNRRLGG